MNSNKLAWRKSFGIVDKFGKQYQDIISYFLHAQHITYADYVRGTLSSPSNSDHTIYVLQVDLVTEELILAKKEAPVLISFQKRKNGNFAIARLFKTKNL